MAEPNPIASISALGPGAGSFIAHHMDLTFRCILHGPSVTTEPEFVRLLTNQPHPFGNFVLLSAQPTKDLIEAAIEPLLQCKAPSAVILLGPAPEPVHASLLKAGFESHAPMPAMGINIEKLPPTPLPAGCTFAELGDGFTDEQWARTFSDGYELPRPVGTHFGPPSTTLDPTLKYFAILKDGKPVCTSLVYLKDGVAGIYGVATLPEERGNGLGAFVTAEPLRIAQKLGYNVGILQASEAGHPVYKRLGFADFGALPLYIRMPS
jgi:hypothetical protein